jgi:lipopolysaccharide export system protein LptA
MPAECTWLAGALLLLCLLQPAAAARDRDQPIYVEADRAVLREREGYSRYEGNVLVRQGALEMRGHTMIVHNTDDNIDRLVLTGKPATIVQYADDSETDLHAEAGRMEYRAAEGQVVLTGSARVWQADGKEFRSEKIVYDVGTRTVNAGDTATGDRVHITLQPKRKGDEAEAEKE